MKVLPCVLLALFLVGSRAVSGVSSPNGYLVQDFYEFSSCAGNFEERYAVALNTCVSSGLRAEPNGNFFFIYTLFNESSVSTTLYGDSICQDFVQDYPPFSLESC